MNIIKSEDILVMVYTNSGESRVNYMNLNYPKYEFHVPNGTVVREFRLGE